MAANHPDQLKTWVLRVYIHCEGCRKKVYKILQNIDGVYKTEIDSQQHKAIVTGSVTGDTLVQKLLKSGKHAEILTEKPETKKKQSNKKKPAGHDDPPIVQQEEEQAEPTADDGEIEQNKIILPIVAGSGEDENDAPPTGQNDNNKKKKKKKKNKKVSPNNETENQPANNNNNNNRSTKNNNDRSVEYDESPNGEEEQSHFVAPSDHQMVNAAPHNLPPYFGYYPTTPVANYGMSYNTSYPSSEASYYTPPVYGYAQSHPSAAYHYNPTPMPPPQYYRRSAFDDDQEDDGGEGKGYCSIM